MIQEQFKKWKNPTGLLALQQIADFMTTNVPNVYPAAPQGGMAALNMSEAHQAPLSKNTGVGCHFLLQGIFPTQGPNPSLLLWHAGSLH